MQSLLVLNIDPRLEADLVDCLLGDDNLHGFSSFSIDGHGDQKDLTIAEQVAGYRRRKQFQILLDATYVSELITQIGDSVAKDIFYWEQPITRSGTT